MIGTEAMILLVTSAEYLGGHTLLYTFNNGEKRKVDLSPLLELPAYKDLKEETEFVRYEVDGHGVLGERGRHCSRVSF